MQSIKLFSFTKNIDLHAVSASEAITSFMRYDRLVKLRRFLLTTFDVGEDTSEKAVSSVETILSRTLDILNPNNEGYRFHTLLSPKPVQNVEVFLVYVSPLFSTGEVQRIDRIRKKSGVSLNALRKGVVWELHVKSLGKTREELQEDVMRILVNTTSREKGMLCNPLFEKAEFLDPQVVFGSLN